MRIDRHARQSAKKFFRACLRPDGSVDEPKVREVMQLLVNDKPRGYIATLERLRKLLELALEERTVRVESATPLADEGKSIFTELEKKYGPASRNLYQVNPALLGGLRIRRGSNTWDGTLSNRLQRLQQSLG